MLPPAAQRISEKIFSELLRKRHFEDTSFVLPMERLSLENASEVGGKAANLGEVGMSVACIVMINAKVSGVMYTVDPNDSRHAMIMISAVWGLAADAVDGSAATE